MNNYKTGTQGKTMYNDTMQTAYVGSHDTDLICVQSIQMVQNCHIFLQKKFFGHHSPLQIGGGKDEEQLQQLARKDLSAPYITMVSPGNLYES